MTSRHSISEFAGTPAKRLSKPAASSAAKSNANEREPNSRRSPKPQGLERLERHDGRRVLAVCGDGPESGALLSVQASATPRVLQVEGFVLETFSTTLLAGRLAARGRKLERDAA